MTNAGQNVTDAAGGMAPVNRVRFSLGNLVLLTAVLALSLALFLTNRKLWQTERELEAMRPLPVEEVARQFEARTKVDQITTTVKDVRYSPKEDAYRVGFSWTDKAAGQTWFTDVKLVSDGFGDYYGKILNPEFAQPLGHANGFTVVVQTPSALKK
jgi:hypothetical protein